MSRRRLRSQEKPGPPDDGPQELHSELGQGDGDRRPLWVQDDAKRFFEAFQQHGTDWPKVARHVRTKDPADCEALHRKFRSFLSLPKALLNVTAFLAVVKDSLETGESEDAETISDRPSAGSQESQGAQKRFRHAGYTDDAHHRGQATSRSGGASPAWGSRRPRVPQTQATSPPTAPRDAPVRGKRSKPFQKQQASDSEDAEGIDALLSLAAVAQEASQEKTSEESRPVRSQRRPKKRAEPAEEEVTTRAPRKRTLSGRMVKSPVLEPPRTPSSRAKREKARRAAAATGSEAADPDVNVRIKPESQAPRHSKRSARTAARSRGRDKDDEEEEEEEEKPPRSVGKRTRRLEQQPDERASPKPTSPVEEADLEAEKEDLEAEDEEEPEEPEEPMEWSPKNAEPLPRRRRRKSAPERPPPMMASAKAVHSRRNAITFSPPPPALLLGVPPLAGQIAAIETEGQISMGTAEVRLRHALDPRVRRWCQSEFFYSAIDRPWFMRNELVEYLQHIGIPTGTRLTRPEMSIIRASLGRPRRLSLCFLRQERVKLEGWRERVRDQYMALGAGAEVPPDLPRQIAVGHKVTARHPITRHIHDGDVLTVAPNAYRVQFERRELGVELVKDTDVMPTDPTENLPTATLHQMPLVTLNGRQPGRSAEAAERNEAAIVQWMEGQKDLLPAGSSLGVAGPVPASIQSLADMKAALDTKETLLAQLKRMNDEVDAGLHKEVNGQRPEAFQKSYAQVLVDLQMMNKLLDNSAFNKQLPMAAMIRAPPEVNKAAQTPELDSQPQDGGAKAIGTQEGAPQTAARKDAWESIREEAANVVRAAQKDGPTCAEDEPLAALGAGCVGMLLVLQRCSEVGQPLSHLEEAVAGALKAIRPLSERNTAVYSDIQHNVTALKTLLRTGKAA